jgi:MAF protein
MRKIYLASDSKARKKLLSIFGLKFKVMPSKIKEDTQSKNLTFASLVKRNALNKAKNVAARVKNGVVIAADTIVVQNGEIFGKPKDLKDARRMLKRLSRAPQWLYTGLAVIDKPRPCAQERGKERNKTIVDYEKTKVYMDELTDSQINDYFARVSPLDKAGSFDIQGRGAFFIRRIEGCFYNVVGLPVRKLYLILKKLGVRMLVFVLCVFLFGCSSEYNVVTKQEEIYFYSTDREVAIGQSMVKQIAKEYKFANDPLISKRVEDIGNKIVAVSDRKDIDYHFYALEEDEVNAVSLPGGYVYVFKGLVNKVANDDELAGVLAHEVGHIVARHSIKKLQAMMGYSLLRVLLAQAPQGGNAGTAADVAFAQLMSGYAREDEMLADQLGVRYLKAAGYDPYAMITFLRKLQEIDRRKPLQAKAYFKSHPYVPDRIRVVKQELGQNMEFDDYINIEQKPHGK